MKHFFETTEVARRATRPLADAAEVGLVVDGAPARFRRVGGQPALSDQLAADPDFTLEIPRAAVERLTAEPHGDIGELGIRFFQLVLEREPSLRIRVRLDAGAPRLVARGYLGVLALGGVRVALWLVRKGFASPIAAIDRLRRR